MACLLTCLPACTSFDVAKPQTNHSTCLLREAPPAPIVGLNVQPDDGVDSLVRELDAATCSIDLSVYLLSEPNLIDALGRAVHRGVSVRVMLEEHPFGGGGNQDQTRELLESQGVQVRWSGEQTRFSHAKYMLIDGEVAVIMNQNLTTSAFADNRDFAVITTYPEEVRQAQLVFDLDWEHNEIDDPSGPLVLSPTNSRERLIGMIDAATTSIDFYAEIIRDDEFVAAIERALARGVIVRLIVDRSIDDEMRVMLTGLATKGLEVGFSRTLYVHAKLMVIDDRVAVVGSHNPTATSLDQNREVSMVVTDPLVLDRARAIFTRDWLQSTPFDGTAVQHDAGSSLNAFQVNFFQSATEPASMSSAHPASTICWPNADARVEIVNVDAGMTPLKARPLTLSTRPRMWSGASCCKRVWT
jgi:cardiolipin synthase